MKIDKSNIHEHIDGTLLICWAFGITSIEDIPDYITEIYCSDNKLTSLPMLPDSLEYLDCADNQLINYPTHGKDKQWFINHNNQLKLNNRIEIINKINKK